MVAIYNIANGISNFIRGLRYAIILLYVWDGNSYPTYSVEPIMYFPTPPWAAAWEAKSTKLDRKRDAETILRFALNAGRNTVL